MVKAENPEAVVATEPQGEPICAMLTLITHRFTDLDLSYLNVHFVSAAQQTLLQSPNAEPPTEENAV